MKRIRPSLFITCILTLTVLFLSSHFAGSAWAKEKDELKKIEAAREDNAQCLRCHGAQGLKTTKNGKTIPLFVDESAFLHSIHESNTCQTCHVGMSDYPHVQNSVGGESFKLQVNKQCQSCHSDVTAAYNDSIHGQLLAQGKETANCSDCHGGHNIFKKQDERSQVFRTNMVHACVKCHEEKWDSYNWGIHGKVAALGSKNRASTCSACHTAHDIYGADDPRSTIHKDNIPETCAQCHLNASPGFAKGIEHYTLTPEGENAPMYYTYKFFTVLLIAVVTFVLLYIQLELYRRIKDAKKG